MATLQAFAPAYGQGQKVTVGAAATLIGFDRGAQNVRVMNLESFTIFVRVGGDNTTIAKTDIDFPIGPNQTSTISVGDALGFMSIISDGGTGTGKVWVTPGVGF